jgi:hypothetical protein
MVAQVAAKSTSCAKSRWGIDSIVTNSIALNMLLILTAASLDTAFAYFFMITLLGLWWGETLEQLSCNNFMVTTWRY